jgi:hypothetical protein
MKVFRLALATVFLGAVVAVGLIPSGYAQTTPVKCNCMVYEPGSPGRYGYKETDGPCVVQTCYT